jgi:hypothetical protein
LEARNALCQRDDCKAADGYGRVAVIDTDIGPPSCRVIGSCQPDVDSPLIFVWVANLDASDVACIPTC